MKKIMILATALVVVGCINPDKPDTPGQDDAVRTNGAYVVCVGVENGYAGACPGSALDCARMTNLLKPYAGTMVSLTDKQATANKVVTAMTKGVQFPLFIFYYSGHGGSTSAYVDTSEQDGRDEYLCLYDTGLLDDNIWKIISKSKGRVFLIFDACHSETMYKLPMSFQLMMRSTTTVSGTGPSILVWSGCPDADYSYGSDTGGEFTNALLKYFKKNLSYDQLWSMIENDKSLRKFERVQRTKIGQDFGSEKIFQ